MKNILIALVIFSGTLNVFSQKHELGIMLGNPNVIADIGKTNYFQFFPDLRSRNTLSYSVGFLYRLNFNPQMGLRLNLNYNRVYFDDDKAKEDYRVARRYKGHNKIGEGSIVFEYNFFDINEEQHFASSPYIFAGIGAFGFNKRLYRFEHELNVDAEGNPITPTDENDFKTTVLYDEEMNSGFSVPFGIGYKFKVNYNWVISAEIGVRFTNTDNLDYSYSQEDNFQDDRRYVAPELLSDSQYFDAILTREANFKNSQITGNLNSNDWYVISGLSLTYAFGRPPCFCKNK